MMPERLDELRKAVDGLEALGLGKEDADGLREALALAKAALPSGDVADDVATIGALWSGVTPPADDWIKAGEALERLAKQAQAAKTWFAKWEQTETLLREYREKERSSAARGGRLTAGEIDDAIAGTGHGLREHIAVQGAKIASLEQMLGDISEAVLGERPIVVMPDTTIEAIRKMQDRVAMPETSNGVWRKRVHEAAEALADVIQGEVGRLDLLARIAELKRQREVAVEAANARFREMHEAEAREKDQRRRAENAEHERDAAVAAHAELLEAARRYDAYMDLSEPWSNGDLGIDDASGLNEASIALHALISGDAHPGATLLAERDDLRKELAAKERDMMLHFDAKNAALKRVADLEARCASLSAAGQVLSEHVDKAAGETIGHVHGCPCAECRRAYPDHEAARKATAEYLSALKAEPPQPIVVAERDTLSIRDEFAKAAMQGLIGSRHFIAQPEEYDLARRAYRYADAMLKASKP